MFIPEGKTEQEVIDAIQRVINIVAPQFVFGYYSLEDIKQEAFIKALEALKDYNPQLPLENFLSVHIRNRLKNLIRDKYHRNDPPCKACHNCINGQTQHSDGKYCEKYLAWKNLNASKAGLVTPLDISNIDDTQENNTKLPDNVVEKLSSEEIFEIINEKLPAYLRADYLKMKAGINVSKTRKDLVLKKIREILQIKQENLENDE